MSEHTLDHLMRGFAERATDLGLRGKKRDDALCDYFVGAWRAFDAVGATDEAAHVGRVLQLLIAPRGYREVEDWMRTHPEKVAA